MSNRIQYDLNLSDFTRVTNRSIESQFFTIDHRSYCVKSLPQQLLNLFDKFAESYSAWPHWAVGEMAGQTDNAT